MVRNRYFFNSALLFVLAILLFSPSSPPVPQNSSNMVTIKTAPHTATRFQAPNDERHPVNADSFFSCTEAFQQSGSRVIGSSFDSTQRVYPKSNGFVDTVLRAYNGHHNLVIRPDDVWIAIISQLSYHINGNAEDLRKHFVAHEGKKELRLYIPITPLEEIDWDSAGDRMTHLIDDNLTDKTMRDWILPAFTTTTRIDQTVSAMLMMSSMKSYFTYTMEMMCGIPHVTLAGTKEDWLAILSRLNKLDSWDDKTRHWKRLLQPIIINFIQTFDGETDTEFWSHVVHSQSYGSGSTSLGGWITAFTVFTAEGRWMGDDNAGGHWGPPHPQYELGGIKYPKIKMAAVASGAAEVDLKIIDGTGKEWETMLIMGNMGMKVIGREEDTVQNVPMWACCLKKPMEEISTEPRFKFHRYNR